MLKKYFYLLSFLPLLTFSQTTTVSSNNNVVGLEHNMLFNAHKRFKVSQSGPGIALPIIFDGRFTPFYTNEGISLSNPTVITIEDLPAYHTQVGAWIGWSTRYYHARRFKIEGYDQHDNNNTWITFADYSNTDYDSNLFINKIPQSGSFTKLRFTFYTSDSPAGLLGISELFFLHPEAVLPYEGLLSNTEAQAIWEKQNNNAIFNTGNVGIGNNNPQAKLDVDGVTITGGDSANFDLAISPNRLDVLKNTGKMAIGWNLSGGPGEIDLIANRGKGHTGGFHFYDYSNGGDLKKLLILNNNGNASLEGKFEAKEIKVTNSPTADFVFDKDYSLLDLESVEKHIKEKKHLPEIASAAEMKKEGVNIGEFQIKLLQKIEELTLYSIEQNKKIQKLEEKIKSLEK